jgi:Uma2 family endonuclease
MSAVLPTPSSAALPLRNGERMTTREFLRRWEMLPQLKQAELIEGVVHMPAAVRHQQHGRPHGWLLGLISTYALPTGVDFGDNATIELDASNTPQPDIYLLLPAELGGQTREGPDGYLEGPPDLIAEIAASSASLDLNDKLQAYQKSGVKEYIVWRTLDGEFDWFVLALGRYHRQELVDGIIKSQVFPGLWINTVALLQKNVPVLYATLEQGMEMPAYRDFASQIAALG